LGFDAQRSERDRITDRERRHDARNKRQKPARGGPLWVGPWLGLARFLAVVDRLKIAKDGHCTAWPAMARFEGGLALGGRWADPSGGRRRRALWVARGGGGGG
jgi:hypothetical protein